MINIIISSALIALKALTTMITIGTIIIVANVEVSIMATMLKAALQIQLLLLYIPRVRDILPKSGLWRQPRGRIKILW